MCGINVRHHVDGARQWISSARYAFARWRDRRRVLGRRKRQRLDRRRSVVDVGDADRIWIFRDGLNDQLACVGSVWAGRVGELTQCGVPVLTGAKDELAEDLRLVVVDAKPVEMDRPRRPIPFEPEIAPGTEPVAGG